jgi:N-acylglucosamine 2-epimerase
MKRSLIAFLICLSASCCATPDQSENLSSLQKIPDSLAGMSLESLADDYRARLFGSYLPFWEHGGIDGQNGGFICHLNDDGLPVDWEKNLWYQGRGLWVYSFLYNNFGHEQKYLDIARKTYGFLTKQMYVGDGGWHELVDRDGKIIESEGLSVFGLLFTANGLAEYHRATGEPRALELTLETLHAALERYDSPGYRGVFLPGDLSTITGVRTQGHSMVIIRLLTQLLRHHQNDELERLAARHVELLTVKYFNPEFGIVNEYLDHDYNRIGSFEDQMFTGHSIETSWMLMDEALRLGDRQLFELAVSRFRRYLEMSWDYVYGGLGSGDFFVEGTDSRLQGTDYGVKTMWLQCEAMLGCLMVMEYTGAPWAASWYGRIRDFTLGTVADNGIGVWAQAANRQGRLVDRASYHSSRKGNFHQPRYMMLNLLSLQRMINNGGKLTSFPELVNHGGQITPPASTR